MSAAKAHRVYRITSPGSEYVYIGTTDQALSARLKEHRAKAHRGHQGRLSRFLLLHPEAAISEISVEFTRLAAYALERAFIAGERKRLGDALVLNTEPGGRVRPTR